jgi:hypothetical protein
MSLDRRSFLKLGASAIVAGVTASACAGEAGTDVAAGRPRLLDMLGPERVRAIGNHYRANVPREDNVGALRAAISAAHTGSLHLPWAHDSIEDVVRDDFAAGRTVLVDGWVLSVTEARQCALFSLGSA